MRERNAGLGRLWLAAFAAIGLAGLAPAALTDAQQQGLSYYSTFDDATKGIDPELGTGTWNTDGGTSSLAFITVTGSNRALDLATYNKWTDTDVSQGVLSSDAEEFTIAFSAWMGSTAKGILFAFGNSGTNGNGPGGLSFRRGDTPGSFVVCTGQNVACITVTPKDGADVTYRHYALVKDADGLRLYVDGEAEGESAVAPQGTVIASQFQWGSRHGNQFSGEARGNGAIASLGVWTRALEDTEVAALAAEMNPAFEPVSFDVPEGWTSKPVPTQTVQRSLTGNLALEQDNAFRQTLGGRAANVAEITGSSGTYSVYGISDKSMGDKSTLERDVWLKVSGGSHDLVVGGKDNHWLNSHANTFNGDFATELAGADTRVRAIVGGVMGCSDGGKSAGQAESDRAGLPLTGNTLVTIRDGAKVSGSIAGSAVPMHGLAFTHTGNSTVRVFSLQDTTNADHGVNEAKFPGGYIVGASARADNQDRGTSANLIGNSKVEILLEAGTSGTFNKIILGGSFNNNSNAASTYRVSGNADVVIDAPSTVTFPKAIYAAGTGKNVTVEGKATITLKGGTFMGATLGVGADGATAGSSELVIDGGEAGIDLSAATVNKDFTALTLKSDLNLGTNRLPGATFTLEGEQTLTLEVTAEELADRCVVLGRAEAVPEGLTIAATGLLGNEAWELTVAAGELRYAPRAASHIWEKPTDGSAWADGLPGFKTGDDVTFGANDAQEPVTLDDDVRVGGLTVAGNYTLTGGGLLSADTATLSGTLTLIETEVSQPSLAVADTLEVSGTLGGAGAISAGSISFADSSTLVVPTEGMLTLEGTVSGTATLDVSAWELTDATVRPVLRAPTGLTLTPPEGYTVHYKDGRYWLARALTQPLTLALGTGANWLEAAWQDASVTPITVAPAQWDTIPAAEVRTEVTATEVTTLTLEAARTVGAFTVKPSEHTLTLGGAKLTASALTVEEGATLAATPATLALAGATIDGRLTYDVASGSTALPALAGSGTLVKTGAGTLTLDNGITVAPTVEVREGILKLSSSNAYANLPNIVAEGTSGIELPDAFASIVDTAATITLRNGGKFVFTNGNSWATSRPIACAFRIENDGETPASFQGSHNGGSANITGKLSGYGVAIFEAGKTNPYTISGVISDAEEGVLALRFADDNNAITVSGDKDNTYSGGTEIASAVTVSKAEALGVGDVTIAADKTLTVAAGKTLNLHRKVGGLGTVSGAVKLLVGASVDASAATAEACLTVGTLAADAEVPVVLPADVAPGTKLLAWRAVPEGVTFVAAEETPLAPTARLVAGAEGLTYEVMAFGTAGSDGVGVGTLSEGAQRTLAAAAFEAGVTSVASVTGTTAKRSLTAAEIDAALTCFSLAPTVTVAEGGVATVAVAYDFGIAAMAYDSATGSLAVTARVQGTEDAAAAFAEGVRVELYATDDPTAVLASAEATAGEAEVRLEVEPAKARAKMERPLKVRAVKP